MAAKKNLIGNKYGRLTVISEDFSKKSIAWLCICDCGNSHIVVSSCLVNGSSKSCGCLWVEKMRDTHTIHNSAKSFNKSSEYNTWLSIKSRCTKDNNKCYYNYGGRGIKICDRWLHSFENFLEDMGYKPSNKHSIDRIDNNGDYSPENCKWSTSAEQSRNKRSNKFIEYNGIKMILLDWALLFGVTHSAINRHFNSGKSFDWIYNHFTNKNKKNELERSIVSS